MVKGHITQFNLQSLVNGLLTADGVFPNLLHLGCVPEGRITASQTFDWFFCHCWYRLLTDKETVLQ